MATSTMGTIAKWGNSQGIRISKEICDALGIHIGSPVELTVNHAKSEVLLSFPRQNQKYTRNRKVSMAELCAGYTGDKVGEEWGGSDVGAEVVE